MSGGGQKKAKKSSLKLPICSEENDCAPPRKRVSFSKRVEIQEFGTLTNEIYSAFQSSSSGSSSSRGPSVSHLSQPTLPILPSYLVNDSVDMDLSFTQNASENVSIFPNVISSVSEMDISMDVIDEQNTSTNLTPQDLQKPHVDYCSINQTMDVSMDTCGDASVNMDACCVAFESWKKFTDSNNEYIPQNMAEVTLSCSPKREKVSYIDVTRCSGGTPKVDSTPNNSDNKILLPLASGSSIALKKEQESHDDPEMGTEDENSSAKSFSNHLEELDLPRATPVNFDVLGSVKRPSPAVPLPQPLSAPVSQTPLAKVVVTARRTLPALSPYLAKTSTSTKKARFSRRKREEFSLSLPGVMTGLSAERGNQLSRSLCSGLDSFVAISHGVLESVKMEEPPVVERGKRITMNEFMNDVLQLDLSSAIDVSAFDAKLAQVIPLKLWESGELHPVSGRLVRHFLEDVKATYGLVESGRTAELQYRMGQSAKVLLTGTTKFGPMDPWTKFLTEFNQLSIEQKTQRISALREHLCNRICPLATKRMLSELSGPINKLESQVRKKLNSVQRDILAKKAELKRLQEELHGWTEILEDDASFIAIKKAREYTDEIKGQISAVLRERKELQRQQLESLKHSKDVEEVAKIPQQQQQQHPISYFVGLGTSLTAYGPPVPQSRILEACRRLFSFSEVTCVSARDNSYKITTFYGLITLQMGCIQANSPLSPSAWSASSLEVANLDIEFRRNPALVKTTNAIGEYAFIRFRENWQLILDNLLRRTLEDVLDFFEFVLHSYALLAMCLHALCSAGIGVNLETSWYQISVPDLRESKSRSGPWRFSKDFYALGRALSLEISRDLEPFKLTGYIAPKNSPYLLKTQYQIYSPRDLFKPESAKPLELKDLFGNSRLDLFQNPTFSATDNIVAIHEKLLAIAKTLE